MDGGRALCSAGLENMLSLRVVATNNNFSATTFEEANFAPTCNKIKEVASKAKLMFNELRVLLYLSLLISTLFKLNQPLLVAATMLTLKKV